jgi:serine/threonine protein kinase
VRRLLGGGGFGSAYQVSQSGVRRKCATNLCLKVAALPEAWHREAYFGQLLQGVSRSIAVIDSFATFVAAPGAKPLPLYCLVTELAQYGDLFMYLRRRKRPWTEYRACREVAGLLRALIHLHEAGAVHRDLTLGNVLVCDGEQLKLGDFGIARHRLSRRAVPADVFTPGFAPPSIVKGNATTWRPADDVYQMGRILAHLLGVSPEDPVDSTDIKALTCGAHVKAIIQRAIGDRRKRYQDAAAMLAAIDGMGIEQPSRTSIADSLKGKFVVFTGPLSAMNRREAGALAKRVGAHIQPKVTSQTDIVVRGGVASSWKAGEKGQKLLDVDREREKGHEICVIGERRFLALVS